MAPRTTFSVLVVLCLIVVGNAVLAQPGLPSPPDPNKSPTSDTADAEWDTALKGKFSASQAAYKDWQEGGLNSLSFSVSLDGDAERKGKLWAQSHSIRLALGFLDQEGRQIRKSEDLIRLHSGLQFQGSGFFKRFNPTLSTNLRTQFASGFNYSENPYEAPHPRAGEEPPVQTSAFFSPATVTESLGLTYEPIAPLSLLLGAASKQTIVMEPDFRVLYGLDEDNTVRTEAGGQFVANLNHELAKNVQYQSELNLFFALSQLNNPPDVIWQNAINLRVNGWLTTDLQFVALFDKDTTRALQLKEVISIGVTFSVL